MAKIYTKNTWTDELLAGAERYDVKDNAGAAIETNVQINLTTPVAVAGTEINASRMNNIETGIDALDTLSAPGSVMRASGANVQTLTANKTLVDADYALQVLTPTAARDVTLPAVASTNHPFYIINASATYVLTVKNAAAATIGIVAISSSGSFASDAVAWHSFGGGGSLTKAAGSDVTTGTDDAKYVTAKAIKDSVNVPNVAPGTIGNVMTSTGSAWASSGSPVLPSLYERDTRITGGASTSATTRRTLVVTPALSTIAVNIAGALRTIPASTSLDLDTAGNWDSATYATAANRAGKDFYLYACENSGASAPLLILSANATAPSSGTTPRKIGGFHCLCVNVGTIADHTLTGYIVGDILPQSVWDLKWKPKNITPEGMVYSPSANIWVDIYLLNSSYTSTYATGAGALVSTNWMNFVDGVGSVGKRLLRDFEFQLIASGGNEQTNIAGSAWVASRGGHVDTASRRMISNIGCEDCAGLIWQWLDEQSYWYAAPSEGWFTTEGSKGQMYLQSSRGDVKLLAGGPWGSGAACGSRARNTFNFRWGADASIGARAGVEPG